MNRPRTLIDDVEPLTALEREKLREQWAAEWLDLTIARLTPAQRAQARKRLQRKLEPKGRSGRRPRWTAAELSLLRTMHKQHLAAGWSALDSRKALARLYGVKPKTIINRLPRIRPK